MILLNDYLYNGDTVVKILHCYSHDLKESAVKSGKDVTPFGVAHILLPLGHKEVLQLRKIRRLELRPQHLQP